MAGLLDIPDLLRGLLGGQAPPQQQPQYQAPQQQQPQGLFPGASDPWTAAVQNFTASPTVFGGASNAMLGLRTGQRTDPAGMFQQMAEMTSQLLQRNGVPKDQADLAALDPNAQKAVIGRLFPTYEFKEAGGQGVAFNPYLGTGEPVISMPKGPTQLGPGEVPVFTQPSFPSARSGVAPPTPLSRMPPVQSQPLPPPPGVPGQASPTPGAPSGPLPGMTPPPGAGAVPPAPPAPAAGMNLPPGVTMGGTPMTLAQKEEQAGLGKTWVELGKAIQTDAQSASKVKATLSRLRQLNEQAPSGPTAEHWQNILNATGLAPGTVAAGTEFQALSSKMVKDAAGGGLGPGFSEGDRRSIERQVPQLTQDKTGRKNLMDFHEKVADRQLEVQSMAAKWRREHSGSLEGFAEYIANYAEKNPLFPQQAGRTTTGPVLPQLVPGKTIFNGHLYKGGDPNTKSAWEPVT